jgi:DNA-binding beta-propeller fold protein YncE
VWGRGKIWAAGDTDRVIYRIDPARGEVEAPPQYRNCCNLVGLAAEGDILYAAEYFQRSILRYDLRSEKAEGERFIAKSPHLNRPVGLAIGHNDNLYVANGLEPTVVEFDTTTGHYVRTFVHLGVGGKEGIHGVIYAPEVQRYYIASGSTVYEADLEGNLIASYNSPVLKKAYGIALIPSGLNRSTNDRVLPADSNRAPSGSDAFESTDHRMITLLKLASTNPSRLHITGNSGDRYRVLATSNFETWDAIGEVDNPTGEVEFIDRDADRFGRRFYRIEVIGPGR